MFVDVKDLETGKMVHTKLEISDMMHGAYLGDDRYILFLPDGTTKKFSPMKRYLISEYVEPAPEPEQPPTPELSLQEQYEHLVVQYIRERYSLDDELALTNKATFALIEMDQVPQEYLDYRTYVQECKDRAMREVYP